MAFNDKEKASIEEAMQEAEAYLANNNENQESSYPLARVIGVVKNNQHRAIALYKSYDFNGSFSIKPPTDGSGVFVHNGATSQGMLQVIVGSKGAILYGTIDKLPNPLGWILAWDRPDFENAPSKVYVEAGNLYQLEKMESIDIMKKLDASTTNKAHYWDDKESFAAVSAEIKDLPGKVALLGASFDHYVATIIK